MEILAEGHRYKLDMYEGGNCELQFIQKEESERGLKTVANGTTNEEVLRVLIDRMQYLQKKMSSRENALVITKLEEALMWLEKRTNDRKLRNVEGTNKP